MTTVENEIESLFVSLKLNASGLTDSVAMKEVNKCAKMIYEELNKPGGPNTIILHVESTEALKELKVFESTIRDTIDTINSFAPIKLKIQTAAISEAGMMQPGQKDPMAGLLDVAKSLSTANISIDRHQEHLENFSFLARNLEETLTALSQTAVPFREAKVAIQEFADTDFSKLTAAITPMKDTVFALEKTLDSINAIIDRKLPSKAKIEKFKRDIAELNDIAAKTTGATASIVPTELPTVPGKGLIPEGMIPTLDIKPRIEIESLTLQLAKVKTAVDTAIKEINTSAVIDVKVNANLSALTGKIPSFQSVDLNSFTTAANQMQQASDQLKNVATNEKLVTFAEQAKEAFNLVKNIQAIPTFLKFAGQLGYGAFQLKNLTANAQLVKFAEDAREAFKLLKGITGFFNLEEFSKDVADASKTLSSVSANRAVPRFAQNTKQAFDILNKIYKGVPNLDLFAKDVFSASMTLAPVTSSSNVTTFAKNTQKAFNMLSKMGSMPQLKELSQNAKIAADGLKSLNRQLAIYEGLMRRIKGGSPGVPRLPGPPRSTGGGGRGGSATTNMFGFDPLRRSMSTLTGMATGMVVGFLGFELIREVSTLDDAMVKGMSLLNLHMRQQGQELLSAVDFQAVRRTMENEILNLSRRVATGPHELAEAFVELSRAGYGTEASIKAIATVEQFAFVHTMKAADAVKHLTTLQRQLNMTSMDAVQNATNLTKIADMVTSGAALANISIEQFMRGLEQITPHLALMNRGLEDGVALMTAMSRINPTRGAADAEAALRAMTALFVKSEESPMRPRSGPGPHSPISPHDRGFHPGMGVHPASFQTNNTLLASQAFKARGIDLFSNGEFVGPVEAIKRIATATQGLIPLEKERMLLELGLEKNATKAIVALISSSEAMETFLLAAKHADGTLRDLADVRMQSFANQMKILQNNVFVVAIQIGRMLVPVLREVNAMLLMGFDAWNQMGEAGQRVFVVFGGVLLGLAALRFMVPYTIMLLKKLFWDTLVLGGSIASSVVVRAVYMMILPFQMLYYTIWGIGVAIRWMLISLYALPTTVAIIRASIVSFVLGSSFLMGLFKVSIITLKFVWGLLTGTILISKLILAGWNVVVGLTTALVHWLDLALFEMVVFLVLAIGKVIIFTAALITKSIALLKSITLVGVLTGSLAALNVVLTYTFAVLGIGLVIILAVVAAMWGFWQVLVFLSSVMMSLVTGAFALFVAGLQGISNWVKGIDWSSGWDSFRDGARDAFWTVAGFLENFQENMRKLFSWFGDNWTSLSFRIENISKTVLENLIDNIEIAFSRMIANMVRQWNDSMGTMLGRINLPNEGTDRLARAQAIVEARRADIQRNNQLGVLNPHRILMNQRLESELAEAIRQRDLIQEQIRQPVADAYSRELRNALVRETVRLGLGPEATIGQMRARDPESWNRVRAAAQRAAAAEEAHQRRPVQQREFRSLTHGMPEFRPLPSIGFNYEISPESRRTIESFFRNPMEMGRREEADAGNKIGDTFKEIALRRFVLEGTQTGEDLKRNEEMRLWTDMRDYLRQIAEREAEAELNQPWQGPQPQND